jgi:hypothetical protein
VVLGFGFHTNTGRSFGRRGPSRSVSQSFLKEKAEHSESLKTCANGAAKKNTFYELLRRGQRNTMINKGTFSYGRE